MLRPVRTWLSEYPILADEMLADLRQTTGLPSTRTSWSGLDREERGLIRERRDP
jgi:hypothetical protein